jgi:hypothetical protein
VTNQVVDMGLLTQTAEPVREILSVETIDVVADRGYFKAEGYRGLRESRLHSSRSQAAARLLGARGPVSQGTSFDTTPSATPTSARPESC